MKPHLAIYFLVSLSVFAAFFFAGCDASAFPMSLPSVPDAQLHSAIVDAAASLSDPNDRVDLDDFATAVEIASNGDRSWAALLVTVAGHESNFSARIASGQCKPWQCDSSHVGGKLVFRASGLFQSHKNLNNLTEWGSTDMAVQVASASRQLRRSYWSCRRLFPRNMAAETWVQFTLASYAGLSCDARWDGGVKRLATWERIRGKL